MARVGVRDLARHCSEVITNVEETHQPVLVTRHGRAVAVITPVDTESLESLEDYFLAHSLEFVADMERADEQLATGGTVSLSEALAAARESSKKART